MSTKPQWERREGVVTDVRYTSGSDGRQWTYIDGVRYATWWDIRTRDWREGDRVTFDAAMARAWANSAPELRAENIRKVAAATGTQQEGQRNG